MSASNRRIASGIALAATLVLVAGLAASCQKKEPAESTPAGSQVQPAETTAAPQAAAPAEALPAGHIEVQHVLIGFQGTVPGKPITRSEADAKKLAYEILDRARKGEDFGQLVRQYSDDQYPGIYRLADRGVAPLPDVQEYPRDGMVKGFSDVAFSLKIGEVGIADFNLATSKYGWHIIKRLR